MNRVVALVALAYWILAAPAALAQDAAPTGPDAGVAKPEGDPDAGAAEPGFDGGVRDSTGARPDTGPSAEQPRGDAGAQNTDAGFTLDDVGEDAFTLQGDAGAGEQAAADAAENDETESTDEPSSGDAQALPERQQDEELYSIPEVVVSHSREDLSKVAGSAHVVDEETLETYENDDPHDVVLQVPGVYVRQEDGFGLRPNIGLRGASAERSKKVTLMEDGVPLAPAPYSAPAAYYFPIMTRMTGVEVFKGPSAILYGPHTVGGAINMQTRRLPDAGESKAGVDVALGNYVYGKLHGYYGRSTEHFGAMLEAVHLQSDGFKELDGGGNTGFNKQEFMLKLGANSDPADRIFHRAVLKLGFSRENSNETYLGLSDGDFRQNPDRRYAATQRGDMEWHRIQAQLNYLVQVGDQLDIVTSAYRHDFSRSWEKLNRFRDGPSLADILANPDSGRQAVFYSVLTGQSNSTSSGETLMVGTNARDFVSQGVQTKARYRFGRESLAQQLEIGLRLHQDEVVRNHSEDGFLMQDGRLVADERPTRVNTNSRGRARAIAAHAMYAITYKGLTVKPGLRGELIWTDLVNRLNDSDVENRQHAIMPGLGLHYAFTDELGVLAGAYRGFSPVSPGQPEGVEPETSINYEFGGRYSTEQSQIELIGFFNDYSNLVGECRFSVGCTDDMIDQQFNAGEVNVYGAEFLAAHAFDLGSGVHLPARLTYTFTDTEFQTDFTSANPQFGEVSKGDELPYVPHHQLAARVGVQQGKDWGAHLSVTYVGVMRETAGPTLPYGGFGLGNDEDDVSDRLTDDYATVDLVGQYQVFDGAQVYVKIDNLFNTRAIVSRRPFGARPTAPVQGRVGFKYNFF